MSDAKTVTVRGRYVGGALFEPKRATEAPEGSPLKYNAIVVLDEGEEKKIEAALAASIEESFPNGKVPKKHKLFGVSHGDDEDYENTFGKNFINPKAISEPKKVIKRDGVVEKVEQDDEVFYAGCYVAISVSAYSTPKSGNPCTTLNFNAVMFSKNGPRLSNSVSAETAFADLGDSEVDGDGEEF